MPKKPNRSLDVSLLVAIIGGVTTILVALISILPQLSIRENPATATLRPPSTGTSVIISATSIPVTPIGTLSLDYQIVSLSQEVAQLKSRLTKLENTNQRLDEIDNRLSNLEEVILDNPGKAVEVVLLRNDIEALKEEVSLLRDEISGSKSQNYLNIALIIPISVTLLGIALSIIRQRRVGGDERPDNDQVNDAAG